MYLKIQTSLADFLFFQNLSIVTFQYLLESLFGLFQFRTFLENSYKFVMFASFFHSARFLDIAAGVKS